MINNIKIGYKCKLVKLNIDDIMINNAVKLAKTLSSYNIINIYFIPDTHTLEQTN